MSQHFFSKSEIAWTSELSLAKDAEQWEKENLPIIRKEAEVWERILKDFWEIDKGSETEARAREVVKRHISHLKVHIKDGYKDPEVNP